MPPNSLNILTKLKSYTNITTTLISWYVDSLYLFRPWKLNFSNLLTLPKNLQYGLGSIHHIRIYSFLDELPSRFFFIPWLWGFNIITLNISNNIYAISTFILHDFSPLLQVQIWLPTAWEFSNKKSYWSWNNTNQTHLHLFGTTLPVSPIYTVDFLMYPFWTS